MSDIQQDQIDVQKICSMVNEQLDLAGAKMAFEMIFGLYQAKMQGKDYTIDNNTKIDLLKKANLVRNIINNFLSVSDIKDE